MVIKVKRGASTNFSSIDLEDGELAFLTDTQELYIGYDDVKINLTNPPAVTLHSASYTAWTDASAAIVKNFKIYRYFIIELSSGSPTAIEGSIMIPTAALPESGTKTFAIPYTGGFVTVSFTETLGSHSLKRVGAGGGSVNSIYVRGYR